MFVCPECGGSSQTLGPCPTDGAPLAPIGEDVLLGSTIGAYRVARLLGIGGMGRVYKGVHPTIGSRVAIKVLSRECTDRRELVDRFFAEAKAVNLIRHESIVNVLDLATLPDGRPYIIMEYLDGAPLASIIEHGVAMRTPLPLGGLARLAVEVLDALGAAHGKGIIHRDLKPDNIFVTPSGRPKVLDFGIAKLNDMSTGSATRTGSLLGTPHYMSPEQAAGKPVEHRADIYAMGVILYECVTGQKPFVADSLFDLLRMHIEMPPPPARQLRPDLSQELEHVIYTALAKLPEQRFASAQAMSVALQHATSQLSAEQWTPITGSGTHRMQPSGVWQHTPPASWGSGSHARGPRESVQPPNLQPAPHIGQQSTVSASAGQLQKAETRAAAKPTSKKGLWIALAAVVLVGAGVTTAALLGGGPDATAAKPAEPPPVMVDDEKPEPTERADNGKPETAGAGETDPAPDEVADKQIAEAEKQADKQIAEAEKQAEKHLGDAAKRLEEVKQLGKKGAEVGQEVQEILQTPRGGKNALWDGNFNLGAFKSDPKRVDVSAFIRYAIAEAKKADPDAVLFRIDAENVAPDGTANLTLPSLASDESSIELRFISTGRMKRDPNIPLGAKPNAQNKVGCEFRIEIGPHGVSLSTMEPPFSDAEKCAKEQPVPAPKCSVEQMWKKAQAKGAPSGNVVANLGYRSNIVSKKIVWFFDIGEPGEKMFSETFNDGC